VCSPLYVRRRPILRIPTLAIHLDRSVNTDGFKFNLESELKPILGLARSTKDSKEADKNSTVRHQPVLLDHLSKTLSCKRTN